MKPYIISLNIIHSISISKLYNFECIVTVYTQFGYAQMDVDKYKDDFNPQNLNASPEKKPADDQ